MMDTLFDCSQFILANDKKPPENLDEKLKKIWHGDVLIDSQIAREKITYIQSLYGTEITVFEFEDKEFLGEFEEWSNTNEPPPLIRNFSRCFEILYNHGYDGLKIILVNDPGAEEKFIYEKEATPEKILNALYLMSHSYHGEGSFSDVLKINFVE